MKRLVVAFMFLAGVVYASPSNTITTPNTFVANTTIQSAQVNDNSNEVSNKYNAHDHTDITQLGTIISGIWSGTLISTQFGGTGLNNASVVQGSLPYFNGTGTMGNLTPGTSGQLLTSGGTGANVSWTGGGAVRDIILKGFEASASVGNLDVRLYGGALFHGVTGVNVATTTVLTLATAGDWASGSVVTYGGGAGWCYVGVTNTASETNKGVYLLGNAPPNRSDIVGNASGTLLYRYEPATSTYYRIIGAFRIATTDRVQYTQFQSGDTIMWDIPINVATAHSQNAWSASTSCATAMPAISKRGIFGLLSYSTNEAEAYVFIRPNGSTWSTNKSNSVGIEVSGGVNMKVGGQRICMTDSSQQIQYYTLSDDVIRIDVEGYYLNIR